MLGNLEIKKLALAGCMFALLGATACGDSASDDSGADGGGGGGNTGGNETCGPDPANTKGTAETGSVKGVIKRSDDVKLPTKGDLYLAVMPAFNPIKACPGSAEAPTPVANFLARCVELATGDYAYQIDGVKPGEEFTVVPFLDINQNVDPSMPSKAGPDTCDLLATGAKITVPKAGDVVEAQAIVLGSAGLLEQVCGLPKCME